MKILLLSILLSLSVYGITFKIIDLHTGFNVENAQVIYNAKTYYSDKNGFVDLNDTNSSVIIKKIGYRPYKKTLPKYSRILKIKPINIKAMYLSFWGANINSKTLKRIMKFVKHNQINSIIVDVKNEFGLTSYKTDVKLANSYGAHKQRTIYKIDKFLKYMKKNNIYTIARIVVFKDTLQAEHNPSVRVKFKNGKDWIDKNNLSWVNPYNKKTHIYTIDIAKDAAKKGFDEINFDYVRFPTRVDLDFNTTDNVAKRIKTIANFLSSAKKALKPYGVFISADTYGEVCYNDKTTIGHTIEMLDKNVDYIAPMLYPSGFAAGTFGYKDPTKNSYAIIKKSILSMHKNTDPQKIRPWLQAFKDYAHSRDFFYAKQVNDQIQASIETKSNGWMLWNPSSRYKKLKLSSKEKIIFDYQLKHENFFNRR